LVVLAVPVGRIVSPARRWSGRPCLVAGRPGSAPGPCPPGATGHGAGNPGRAVPGRIVVLCGWPDHPSRWEKRRRTAL